MRCRFHHLFSQYFSGTEEFPSWAKGMLGGIVAALVVIVIGLIVAYVPKCK
jgi:hypothetical protein